MSNDLQGYIRREKFEIGREVLVSIIVSSLVASGIGFYFNKKVDERIASREFIYNYSRTFVDNPKYRNISIALEKEYLYGNKFPDFREKGYSEYDLDCLIETCPKRE